MDLLSMPSTAPAVAVAATATPGEKDDSEDLFSAHDFDVQIEMALPGEKSLANDVNFIGAVIYCVDFCAKI